MKRVFVSFIVILLLLQFSCKNNTAENDVISINHAGIALMNAGKYDSALLFFIKALKSSRLTKDFKGTIYRNIALTYKELDKADSAIHFSTLAAKCYYKNSFDYLVNTAEADLAKGKITPALTRLHKAVSQYPNEMIVNNTLGLIYLGDYGESFMDLDKALVYNSKAFEVAGSSITEEVLAKNYYKMENYEKAASHYEHLLQNDPGKVTYMLNMAMIESKLKKTAEADKLFEAVMAADSSYSNTITVFKEANKY